MHEELSGMKGRSEREIQSLKEHLRLAMAALQEGQQLGNSLDHWESAAGPNALANTVSGASTDVEQAAVREVTLTQPTSCCLHGDFKRQIFFSFK